MDDINILGLERSAQIFKTESNIVVYKNKGILNFQKS